VTADRYPVVEVRPGLWMLKPGYRAVDGKIVYSAAYLDPSIPTVPVEKDAKQ
jgi:hypothetical protein